MALVQYQRNRNVNNKYKPINLFYDIFLLLSHCALEILPDRFVNQTNYPENFSDRFVCSWFVNLPDRFTNKQTYLWERYAPNKRMISKFFIVSKVSLKW